MTTDCKSEILNCISRYREELAENKIAIKKALSDDKIENISDHFYNGSKICDEKKFKAGSECQDTKYNIDQKEYTYNEWKQKIEKSHAKDLLQTLKNTVESRILEKFKDYESYQKEIIEEVRRVLGIDVKLEAEMQKNLQIESKDVDIKLKEMLKSRSQAETDETRICYDIIKSFYRNEDIESELKCRDVSCFENIIGHKELELVNKQDNFLEDTGNILKYIQVEDNIL